MLWGFQIPDFPHLAVYRVAAVPPLARLRAPRFLMMGTVIRRCAGLVALLAVAPLAEAQQPNLPPAKPGFPVVLTGAGFISAIAVGDLDNDGKKEIVVGTRNRQLHVRKHDGTAFPGTWPKTLPGMVESQPALADIDADGFLDIVVATGSTLDPGGAGRLFAFKRDGTQIFSFTPGDFDGNGTPDGIISSPAVGDIDGDGRLEIAVGSLDANVYVFRHDGTHQPGWPRFVRDTMFSSPALADLDGDGRLEVIIGLDTHRENNPTNDLNLCNPFFTPIPRTPDGGALIVFRASGALFPGFPRCIDETMDSSPAVGDIDGDGIPEIVVGTGRFYSTTTGRPVGRQVHAFRRDGTVLPGWPRPVGNIVYSSPALADLDGDGILDVVVGSDDTRLHAFKGNGTSLFSVQPKTFFGTSNGLATSPIVADVLGDGQVEVLIPVGTEVAVISRTGVQLTDDGSHAGQLSFFADTAVSANAIVADLDPTDSKIDVIMGAGTPFPSAVDGKLYVYQPKAPGAMPWPMFHRDPQHTGSVATATPLFTGGVYVAAGNVDGAGGAEVVVGPGAGHLPRAKIFQANGSLVGTIMAYHPAFNGGVRVAAGDVNGDGRADIITAPGPGGGPHVRVFSGANPATELAGFFAYSPAFAGGVFVAAGDVNGDGRADIITAADAGGGPHVRVFSGAALPALVELAGFFAYSPAFAGGVRVAAGDVDGDGRADIITAPGPGGGPHVRVFSGANPATELAGFFAYSPAFAGGVFVAAGDVNGDGRADIITAADAGGGPHVRVFSGAALPALVELAGFFAYSPAFAGGVRVAVGNLDGTGASEIITAPGATGGPHVRAFTGAGAPTTTNFFAY